MTVLHNQRCIVVFKPGGNHNNGKHAVSQRCPGTHGDQRVHAGGAGRQTLEAGNKKVSVDDADGQGQRQLHQRKHQRTAAVTLHKGRQGQPDHMPHGNIHQRHQKAQALHQTAL